MYDGQTTMVSERFGASENQSSVFDDIPAGNTIVKLRKTSGDTDFGF
jgi:hypothetical protein